MGVGLVDLDGLHGDFEGGKVGFELSDGAAAAGGDVNFAIIIFEDGGIETGRAARAGDGGVSEAVIGGALVHVGEHAVRLARFLEHLFRFRVIRIAVGMKLQRELAVGALDLNVRRAAAYAQHFVVIAFCPCGQWRFL